MLTQTTKRPLESQSAAGELPPLPGFFHAGFPKSATTWFHRCLREHPDIYVPPADGLHYFTIHYEKGDDWYRQFFADFAGEKVVGDTTPSYAGFDWCRRRLAEFNPDAKILITLRNPIDRAFSHYFHMKQKRGYPARFEEALENKADLFQWLIAFGFYGHHLTDLFRYFPREQVHVVLYDSIVHDPQEFCRGVFEFLGVDSEFRPSCLDQQINSASRFQPGVWKRFGRLFTGNKDSREYRQGIHPDTKQRLQQIYRPDIDVLEDLLQLDLGHWLEDD